MASPDVRLHLAAAQEAQREQDYASAAREYQAVLALAPNIAEVHMNLGLIYQIQNRTPDAMAEFRKALKIKSSLAAANFFVGVNYCKQGEGEKAIPFLKAAVRGEPRRPDIWSWLATAQQMADMTQEEVSTLKRALKLQPKNTDLLYLLGQAYERLGKDEAIRLQRAAPGSARTEQLLAESYATSNEWPSAVIHFRNALSGSPALPGLHAELGEVLLRAGKLEAALHEFDAELKMNPHSVRALMFHGEARIFQNDFDGLLEDWEEAISIDETQAEQVLGLRETRFGTSAPDLPGDWHERIEPRLRSVGSPAAHLALAWIAARNDNMSQASVEAMQARPANSPIHDQPSCSESGLRRSLDREEFSRTRTCIGASTKLPSALRFQLAKALLEIGEAQLALDALPGVPSPETSYWRARCFEKLATSTYLALYAVDPNSSRVHQLRGDLAATNGEDGKAIEEYRTAVALRPELPNLHYSLGHLLWKDLKVSEARTELEAELKINPRHKGALIDLGDTYLLDHQPQQALEYLNRAMAADPENPDVHRDLGTAWVELREYGKAETEFKIAAQADQDGSVHYKLGKVYQALKRNEDAAHEFAISTALNREAHDKLEKRTELLTKVQKSFQ